ncbi:MAG: hypothetical protein HKN73_20615, partial [Gemmatimonadetes bacterium]|nr:hypothetical protein [Gemmatimonadota bacterium]
MAPAWRGVGTAKPVLFIALSAGLLLSSGCDQATGDGPGAGEGAQSVVTHQIPGFGREGPVITTGDGAAYPPPEVRAAHGTVPPRFGFGRPAGRADIVPWDIDVGPDGAGLPEGSGSPADGAAVYLAKCAHCHGLQGEGGLNDRLVTPADGGGGRTIGSY